MIIEEIPLTDREHDVYLLLLKGYKEREIADELVVSLNTVHTHTLRIYLKKMCCSKHELLAQRIQELEDEIKELKQTR